MNIEKHGVSVVKVDVEGKTINVLSNGMVNIRDFVDLDEETLLELGVTEKVRFVTLCDIMSTATDDKSLKEQIEKRIDELIPKHINVDDIFASINYIIGLDYDIGETDDLSLIHI